MQTKQSTQNAYLGEVLAGQAQVERELKRKAHPAAPLPTATHARARGAGPEDEEQLLALGHLGHRQLRWWPSTTRRISTGSPLTACVVRMRTPLRPSARRPGLLG
jgi:hypothetical protein